MKKKVLVIILLAVLVVSCLALTACTPKYTVTWQNWDGTVLEVDTEVKEGTIPTYNGATPTKAADVQYTYEFAGWDKAIVAVTGETTYTAKFDAKLNSYTVTWLNWDGSVLKTDAVEYGQTPTYTGATPTKEGNAQYTYTFAGWTPSIDNVTGIATYTAQFSTSINTYTVTWKNWDGTVLEVDENIEYGTMPTYDGETPLKEKDIQYTYVFDNWDKEVTYLTGDVSYTAQFNQYTNYSITYNLDGGNDNAANPAYYTVLSETITLIQPEKTGYTFIGWTCSEQTSPVLEVTIPQGTTGDKEYTANWQANTNTITLDTNGDTVSDDELTVTYDKSYTLPTPTRTGYTFEGWFSGKTEYTSGIWREFADVTLVAEWTVNEYTITYEDTEFIDSIVVTFDHNYSDSTATTVTLTNGQILSYPTVPTRDGYAFAGWYTDSACTASYDFSGDITEDITLFAKWVAMTSTYHSRAYVDIANHTTSSSRISIYSLNQNLRSYCYFTCYKSGEYTIYLNADPGFSGHGSDTNYTISVYNVTQGTYIAGDYLDAANPAIVGSFTANAGDVIYVSYLSGTDYVYGQDVAYFYVKNAGYPTSTATASCGTATNYVYDADSTHQDVVEYGGNYTLPIPTRTGYSFLGWYNGDDKVESGAWNIANDVTLVPRWQINSYTITFVTNGGDEIETLTQEYQSDLIMPDAVRDGYTFGGWFGDVNFTTELTTMPASDTTAYAWWTEENKPTDFTFTGTDAITIEGYNGTSTTVRIPSYIGGVPVTSIGEGAFHYCTRLTSITIPEGVTSIGDDAFYYCTSLTSITIPSSVTSIGNSAFYDCTSLTSITIPSSVTSIGNSAFSGCSSLNYYDDGNAYYLGNESNNYLVLRSVKSKNITSLKINENTKFICNSAFYGCTSLTSITIPSSVTSIGNSAFNDCSNLTSVTFEEGSQLTSIGSSAFYDCTSLTSITIPSSVTSIGNSAFNGCSSLTSVTFEEGSQLTSIGSYAFDWCRSLTSITIPEGVTSIGERVFQGCSSLTSVTFEECSQLTSIGYDAFYGCTSLTSITIPDSVTSIGGYAFGGCTGLTSITIPDSVTSIGSYAFSGCSSLTSITISDSVTSIGCGAFYNCTNLTSVTFADPNGWYVTMREGATSGSRLTLTNPSQNAKYLKSTYYYYYWYKAN